ncbi:MAG: hypothetical protein M1480_03110 [Bacteroidetes bacterium]|nr:hypothetical protein [Bacteroidota bacterium]MCL5027990.1 hypothetical protein [Bacteroidota bacterium]
MHIEENKIEQFVLEPEVLNDAEKDEILAHINSCSVCKEIYDTYSKIYVDLAAGINRPGTSNDEEIARRVYQRLSNSEERKLLSEKSTTVQVYNGKTEIVERPNILSLEGLLYYLKRNPLQLGSLGLVSLLAIAFLFITIKKSVKDDNPVYAEVKNGALNIYNSSGEVLWQKAAYGIPQIKSEQLMEWWYPNKRYLNINDLDADGKNEVLVSGDFTTRGLFRTDSLYCFNSDGTKRWVTSPEDIHSKWIPNWKRTEWQIEDFFTTKIGNNKKLFVLANDKTYAMTIVSEINPANGKILSSIYHSGWFLTDLCEDFDHRGENSLIFGGTSNDYKRPVIMILGSGNLQGALDKNAFLSSDSENKGNALYYLLLPVTNYHERVSGTNVVEIRQLEKTDKGFIVTTQEVHLENDHATVGIVYSFDEKMQIRNIIPTNWFQKRYDDLYKKGVFKEPLDSTYFNKLKNSILYWDGDKFVNYPTRNKYWNK